MPGDVRSREAVARADEAPAAVPGDLDVDAPGEELNRRRRVVVVGVRVFLLVAPDGDHAREAPGIALDGHVVGGRDQHRATEVCGVRELVQEGRELLLRRREAHVDDVVALLDRPAESLEQDGAAARVAGAEHPDAHQLALGCQRANDPRASGAVPAKVALGVVLLDDHLFTLDRDRDGLLHVAHQGMTGFDAAVEDAHPRTGAGRSAPRPFARDLAGPLLRQGDPLGRLRSEAPGWKFFARTPAAYEPRLREDKGAQGVLWPECFRFRLKRSPEPATPT